MSLSLLRLLDALRALANAEGVVEVTVAKLAGTLGDLSERQIQRLLRELAAGGRLEAIRTSGGRGRPAQYRIVKGDISAAERVTSAAPKGDIEPERVTSHVTLSAPKGDISAERVTQDVTLFSPLPPFPPAPPIPPTPPPDPPSPGSVKQHRQSESGGSSRPLSPQNLTVKRVTELYQRAGAAPPVPSEAVQWSNDLGGDGPLLALLEDLAAHGHLAKPVEYVRKCVKARKGRPAGAPGRFVSGAPGVDRRRLEQAAALGSRRKGDAA